LFKSVLEEEFKNMVIDNQVRYADRYYELAKKILLDYVLNENDFLPDIGTKYLNIDNGFESIRWDKNTYKRISGTRGYVSGLELTKIRGEYLNKYLYEDNNPAYKFLGTSNGVSAVNVVAGGNGKVGPYAGGWQHNAMGNRLNMCLPDTLHVAPEESANCAAEINNHLHRADAVQNILKLDNPEMKTVEYYDMAMLCDLEQGWCTPEKTRIATLLAIQNGINVIHIEDQGEKKRCGHLGDKELNTYDDYALIMRSANLAAQELLGPEQADKKWVRFVARTDALSAKRIHNSSKLQNENNPEHKFVDWERGTSPDGKYLYLKQGINEETGNPWGLDLSIYRGARIIDEGLATHVWMETPDADLSVAKKHMDGINEILLPKGKRAQSLYNHSPSFDWDVKFYAEAEKLSEKIINWSKKLYKQSLEFNIEIDDIHRYLCKNGDLLQGDHLFSKDELSLIRSSLRNFNVDLESFFQGKILQDYNGLHSNEISNLALKKSDILEILNKDITDTIVERRLKNFGNQLSTLGCNMHLITLPEFHVTAYNMHLLSKDFSVNGINAFVKGTQRPERIHSERDYTYNYYKHQTATGTGVEAAFNVAVGSHDVNTLNDSTEQDDLKKREN
jgi:isocitrate lyase